MADLLKQSDSLDLDSLMERIRERVASRRLAATHEEPGPSELALATNAELGRALAAQAELNRATLEVLESVWECLQRLQQRQRTLETRVNEASDRPARGQCDAAEDGSDAVGDAAGALGLADALKRRNGVRGGGNGLHHGSLQADPKAPHPVDEQVDRELEQLRLGLRVSLASMEALIAQRKGKSL